MASHARGSLKALQLLGNSIHGLNHGNWHLVYNTVCLPVLTYSSPIWYKGQKKLVNILQRVQDFTVRKILGTFCTMPVGPLHQLCTILPMHICLQMLSETAALSLLTILHNSQLIQRLGLPWCDWSKVHDGFLNTPHPAPHTPLSQLANLVPTDSCHPETFKYGPWVRRVIASDHLTTSTNIPCREDRKQLSRDIAKEAKGSQPNMLLLFCHGASPSNEDGTPIATAACIACFKGKVTDSLTHSLGPHTSVKDTTFHALTLAIALTILALHEHKTILHIKIFTTNPLLPNQCFERNTTNQPTQDSNSNFIAALTNILDTYQRLEIAVSWAPSGKGLYPLT